MFNTYFGSLVMLILGVVLAFDLILFPRTKWINKNLHLLFQLSLALNQILFFCNLFMPYRLLRLQQHLKCETMDQGCLGVCFVAYSDLIVVQIPVNLAVTNVQVRIKMCNWSMDNNSWWSQKTATACKRPITPECVHVNRK